VLQPVPPGARTPADDAYVPRGPNGHVNQDSHADPWQDPLGVIDAYKLVKEERPDIFVRNTFDNAGSIEVGAA
jgi:hypothetical protein